MTQQNFNDAEIQEAQELLSYNSSDDWYEHEEGENDLDDFMDIDF